MPQGRKPLVEADTVQELDQQKFAMGGKVYTAHLSSFIGELHRLYQPFTYDHTALFGFKLATPDGVVLFAPSDQEKDGEQILAYCFHDVCGESDYTVRIIND